LFLLGLVFVQNPVWMTATTHTGALCFIFFFSSAASASAYLTVSEIFPLEVRAVAIALFYCMGTAGGGLSGPTLFGRLIGSGKRENLFIGYSIGAALMAVAAIVEWVFGFDTEGKMLEEISNPLSAVDGANSDEGGEARVVETQSEQEGHNWKRSSSFIELGGLKDAALPLKSA
jgi:MFS family permease